VDGFAMSNEEDSEHVIVMNQTKERFMQLMMVMDGDEKKSKFERNSHTE
jgi:hypothetical protein